MTDSAGNVKKNYTYDAFGNEKNPDPNDTNVFRYTGEYFDKETGTIYLRVRYYDPRVGRFVTEDSYWGEGSDPLSLNLYTYCHSDPVNFYDPTGHMNYWTQSNLLLGGYLERGYEINRQLTNSYNLGDIISSFEGCSTDGVNSIKS